MHSVQKLSRFVLLFPILFLLWAFAFSDRNNFPNYLALEPFDTDLLEYQTVAVNFAKGNLFPVMGFVYAEDVYNVHYINPDSVFPSVNYAARIFNSNGPTIFLRKPPAFPVVVGLIYKCFGVNPQYIFIFNLLLLSLVAGLLPYIGLKLWKIPGLFCGVLAGVLFFIYKAPAVVKFEPDVLLSFLVCLIFMVSANLKDNDRSWKYLLLGALLSLTILTKGSILLVPLLFISYLLLKVIRGKYKLKNVLLITTGFSILLVPWMGLANYVRETTVKERMDWNVKNQVAIVGLGDLQNQSLVANGKVNATMVEYLLRYEYSIYSKAEKFIVITNQAAGDQILAMHNELSTDGSFHLEWRLDKNLYYNKNPSDKNSFLKILSFYKNNPQYSFPVAVAKLQNADDNKLPLFWLAIAFLGLCVMLKEVLSFRHYKFRVAGCLALALLALLTFYSYVYAHYAVLVILSVSYLVKGIFSFEYAYEDWCPILLPIFFLNFILLSVLIHPGAPRFTNIMDGISAIATFYFLLLFVTDFWKGIRKSYS